LPGRVGDSPLIGCGTYADDLGAVSCTGHGESIIRVVLARSAAAYLREGIGPQAAAGRAVDLLAEKTGSTGGLIMIDRAGRAGYARNTTHMPVCHVIDGDLSTDS
jgi:L-asparaginase / beta-aspartyl-peptidase